MAVASVAAYFSFGQNNVYANQYSSRIQALESQISRYNQEASRLANEAQSLRVALDSIQNDISVLQAKIDLSQARHDQLIAQIAETEKKIDENKQALGLIIVDLYADDDISPIEMLASSKNIGDYLNKQEYRNSVKDDLNTIIKKVKDLREQLSEQKDEVAKILNEQKAQQGVMVAKQQEQQSILAQTQGEEAAYQKLSSQKTAELADVHRQQQEAINRLTGGGKNTAGAVGSFQYRNYSGNLGSCGGGYPSKWCNAPLDAYVDDWALYSRECVSYAAWAAYNRFGKDVQRFRGMGHAYQWPNTASAYMGANVNNTPAVGSVAITPRSNFTPLGHAMVVEHVYGDGWIRISQYNFAGTGEYSTMDLKATSAQYVHFRNR